MNKRRFGHTDLQVSEVGFGAWAIGGPFQAGDIPLGWGKTDDEESCKALKTAVDRGVNFIDTADFYGLGHSETLIGKTFGNNRDIIIASKVGHRLGEDGSIVFDYSKDYIMGACEASLKRLKRNSIDLYQLHTARVSHLRQGDCLMAMETLQKAGKIRYWGTSLNTYNPFPEAEHALENNLGYGFQLALNIINQRALPILKDALESGFGIIARMPLQFGLLSGKFSTETTFSENDHRHFRLRPPVMEKALNDLKPVWKMADKYGISPVQLSLSFILSFPEVSTVIPGIRTVDQANENSTGIVKLEREDRVYLLEYYDERLKKLLEMMEQKEG